MTVGNDDSDDDDLGNLGKPLVTVHKVSLNRRCVKIQTLLASRTSEWSSRESNSSSGVLYNFNIRI